MKPTTALAALVERRSVPYRFPRDSEGVAKAFLERAEAFLVARRGGQLPPAIVVFTEDTEFVVDGCRFMGSALGKEIFAQVGRGVAKKVGAIASAFFSEMWFAKGTAEDAERVRRGEEPTRPSLREDRIEGVVVVGQFRGMEPHVATWQIVRDSAGGVAALKPLLLPPGVQMSGRFMGILDG